MWYDNTDDQLSKADSFSQGSNSRFGLEDQAISLISNGHVPCSSHQLELYSCGGGGTGNGGGGRVAGSSSKTLPRRGCNKNSHEQFQCSQQLSRAASQELLKSSEQVSSSISPSASRHNNQQMEPASQPPRITGKSLSRSNLVDQPHAKEHVHSPHLPGDHSGHLSDHGHSKDFTLPRSNISDPCHPRSNPTESHPRVTIVEPHPSELTSTLNRPKLSTFCQAGGEQGGGGGRSHGGGGARQQHFTATVQCVDTSDRFLPPESV